VEISSEFKVQRFRALERYNLLFNPEPGTLNPKPLSEGAENEN
jgi:hypothetical protein